MSTSIEKSSKIAPKSDASPQKCDIDQSALSFRDLLELTPEEKSNLLADLFKNDIEVPNADVKTHALNVNNNNNVQTISTVQPHQAIMPKMMFSNSTVTINFNINK